MVRKNYWRNALDEALDSVRRRRDVVAINVRPEWKKFNRLIRVIYDFIDPFIEVYFYTGKSLNFFTAFWTGDRPRRRMKRSFQTRTSL